jgi:hypothetical protein
MDLVFHVTRIRDATAALTHETMHTRQELNGPTYAYAIMTAREVVDALPKP